MRVSWLVVAGVVAVTAADAAAQGHGAVLTCGAAALPGLEAARARLRPADASAPAVVLTALRAASVDEFLQIATAITGRASTDPLIDELARSPAASLPCSADVVARDRLTYALLLGGYSAREIADVVSGRLSRRDLDDAQRLLMAGQPELAVAAFLERAMADRRDRLAEAWRRAERRKPAGRPGGSRPLSPPRAPVVGAPATALADADVQAALTRLARQHQVDPALVLAMVAAESGGDATAVSPKGAVGLMQLMPTTARMLGVDPADPIDNLRGGIAYMAGLLEQFGNPRDALIAYNAGPSHADRVRKGLAVLYGETRRYLDTIGRRYPL